MRNYYLSQCYSHGQRYTHRYVFYFYPKKDPETGEELDKGFFRFFGRVKHGKETAQQTGREYAYEKLF